MNTKWLFLGGLPDSSQIKHLEDESADSTYIDDEKNSVLHIAAAYCSLGVLSHFLERPNVWRNVVNIHGHTILMSACQDTNIHKVRYLLDRGYDINELDTTQNSPLHVAAAVGSLELVKFLVENGAAVNARNSGGVGLIPRLSSVERWVRLGRYMQWAVHLYFTRDGGDTPLHMACANNTLEVVEFLLPITHQPTYSLLMRACFDTSLDKVKYLVSQGAEVDLDYHGHTPLHTAAGFSSINVIKYLLHNGADVNQKTANGDTVLMWACLDSSVVKVDILLQEGLDATAADLKGISCLHFASDFSSVQVMERLVEHGADVNASSQLFATPVFSACFSAPVANLQYLVGQGADPNVALPDRTTPLHMAAQHNKVDMLRYLVSLGADVNAVTRVGTPVLHRACLSRDVDKVRYLLDEGADPLKRNNNGVNCLRGAIRNGSPEVVELLLKECFDPNQTTFPGDAPLNMFHSNHNPDKMLQALLKCGAEVSKCRKNPLHTAVKTASLQSVKSLIRGGASWEEKDRNSRTLLFGACENRSPETLEHLLSLGLSVNEVDQWNMTPLHVAATSTSPEMIKLLIDDGAKVNVADSLIRKTPLHLACEKHNLLAVEILVENQADVLSLDSDGHTPFYIAVRNDRLDLVKYLMRVGALSYNKIGATQTAIPYNCTSNDRDYFLENNIDFISVIRYLLKDNYSGKRTLVHKHVQLSIFNIACTNVSLSVIQYFVSLGFSVNNLPRTSMYPLEEALTIGEPPIIRYLVDVLGADLSLKQANHDRPILAPCTDESTRMYFIMKYLTAVDHPLFGLYETLKIWFKGDDNVDAILWYTFAGGFCEHDINRKVIKLQTQAQADVITVLKPNLFIKNSNNVASLKKLVRARIRACWRQNVSILPNMAALRKEGHLPLPLIRYLFLFLEIQEVFPQYSIKIKNLFTRLTTS